MSNKNPQLAEPVYFGFWQQLVAVKHCLCEDGKRRYARITAQEPDTFFSQRASVNVNGKTVSGFIIGIETNDQRDYKFVAVATGKNAHLLP